MIDPTVYTFVPQILPPTDRAGAAYWFAFQDQKMIVRTAGNTVEAPLLTDLMALGLAPIRQQYLGYLENGQGDPIHCYSAEIDPAVALADGLVAEGLRDLYAPLGDVLFNVAGRAVQVVTWDRTHQYCGQCATPTEALPQERARRCPACGLTSYPRISPGDHHRGRAAGYARRPHLAGSQPPLPDRVVTACSPASSSRASRWKRARSARCSKRSAFGSRTSATSAASRGRSRIR